MLSCLCVQPLFTMSVQQQSIRPFNQTEYEELTKTFGYNAVRADFTLISIPVCMLLTVLLMLLLKVVVIQ